MFLGETIEATATETRSAPFSAKNARLAVTGPDGATVAVSVTISPGAASLTQTLSALFTPSQAGRYLLTWSYVDGLGETIVRPQVRFASWSAVRSFVARRIPLAETSLSDEAFEDEFERAARALLSRFPAIGNGMGTDATIGNYSALSDTVDQEYFDEAAALIVCARLVGPITSGGAPSDAAQIYEGSEKRSFAPLAASAGDMRPGDAGAGPGGYGGANERMRWLREAAERLSRVSDVALVLSSRGAWRPFNVWGPTRNARVRGQAETLISDVIRLFSDSFDLEPAMNTTGV